jgi:hypothetical protein
VIGRHQLAVASPISAAAVARAFIGGFGSGSEATVRAHDVIVSRFGARRAVLTDSGTSALVLALRLAIPRGGVVGFPAYACVDLTAAARFAGVRVRVYDLDPVTLGPDLDAVDALLRRGVDAVVVAHLFGYPADVNGVRERASRAGVPVIEDAAQAAGARLGGQLAGSLGDLSILSFGRGKGLSAGGGGALLAYSERFESSIDQLVLPKAERGWSGLAATTVQLALGRPSVYAIPSMIPWLHLGEMVYHPASEPKALSITSSALLPSSLENAVEAVAGRRRRAEEIDRRARLAPDIGRIEPIQTAEPGYLRFPVRDLSGDRRSKPSLGVLQPYPRTLPEQPELSPILLTGEPPVLGSVQLRGGLFTMPTHHLVTDSDLDGLAEWLRIPGASPAAANDATPQPPAALSGRVRK